MAFERPAENRLVFYCEACDETKDFESDDGQPSFAESWKECQEDGWFTYRPAGQNWEHYCAGCADLAREDIEVKKRRDRERQRIRERNARD